MNILLLLFYLFMFIIFLLYCYYYSVMYVTVMPVSAIHGLGICVWFYPNTRKLMVMMMISHAP